MSAKLLARILMVALVSLFSSHSHAVIIEGKFSGKVVSVGECWTTWAVNCSSVWGKNPEGSIASGSFWYDTELAPKDTKPSKEDGRHFSYTNTWVNILVDIGGKRFDISKPSVFSEQLLGIEHISTWDMFRKPDGFVLQSIDITDRTSFGNAVGDFIETGVSLNVSTWEKRILNGASLIQEYSWQPNGNLLQGSASFSLQSSIDGAMKVANVSIEFNDFYMRIKRQPVPEPSSIALLALILVGVAGRRIAQKR